MSEEEVAMTTTDVPTNGAVSTAIQKTPIQVGSRGVELRTLDDMWRFANYYASSGLAPKGMDRPESIFIAMQAGQELGLGHFQSVQSIASINGRPCLWGDTMKGLVLAHPSCEYVNEWMEEDHDGQLTAWCESKRRGSARPHKTSFSQADALKAGLWSKAGPWMQYPRRMLQVRARAFNLRDNFADVLRGLAVVEEMRDVETHLPAPVLEASGAAPAPTETRTEATRRQLKKPSPAKEPEVVDGEVVETLVQTIPQPTSGRPRAKTEAGPTTPASPTPDPAKPAETVAQTFSGYKKALPAGVEPIDWLSLQPGDVYMVYDAMSVDERKTHWVHVTEEVQAIISAACKTGARKEAEVVKQQQDAAAETPADVKPVDEAQEFIDSKSDAQLKVWFGRLSPDLLRVGREAAGVTNLSEANKEQLRKAAYVMRVEQGKTKT